MALSIAETELLAAELAHARYDALTADQAFAKLHATTETISVTHAKPLTIVGLLGLLSTASMATICDWVHLLDFRQKVLDQDRVAVGLYAGLLVTAGKISADEYDALQAELAATETVDVTTAIEPRIAAAFAGVAGFPNAVTREDFGAAWAAAGRT